MHTFHTLTILTSLVLSGVHGWSADQKSLDATPLPSQSTEEKQDQERFRQQVLQAASRIKEQQDKSEIIKTELEKLEKSSPADRTQIEQKLAGLKTSLASIAEQTSKQQQALDDLQKNMSMLLDINEKVAPSLHQQIQQSQEDLQSKGTESSDQKHAIATLQAEAKAQEVEASQLRTSIAADQAAINAMLAKQKAFVEEMTQGQAFGG